LLRAIIEVSEAERKKEMIARKDKNINIIGRDNI